MSANQDTPRGPEYSYKGVRPTLRHRLPVREDVQTLTYHRPPTPGELRFGEGATHWREFNISEVCHPGTRIPKRYFVADDGLRYYYPNWKG